jgi:hypothetical protein
VLSRQALFVPKMSRVQSSARSKAYNTVFSFSLQPFLAILFYIREGKRVARVEEEGFFDVAFLVWWGEH